MFRYIDRALCAPGTLHPEVMNERLFPSVDALSQMKDDLVYLTQQSDGSYLLPGSEGVRESHLCIFDICTYINIQVLCAIDGVEIMIGKPTHKKLDDTFYSVKKSQHSINIIVICALDSQLLYVSPPLLGSVNDQQAWNSLDLRQKFLGV